MDRARPWFPSRPNPDATSNRGDYAREYVAGVGNLRIVGQTRESCEPDLFSRWTTRTPEAARKICVPTGECGLVSFLAQRRRRPRPREGSPVQALARAKEVTGAERSEGCPLFD